MIMMMMMKVVHDDDDMMMTKLITTNSLVIVVTSLFVQLAKVPSFSKNNFGVTIWSEPDKKKR